MKVSRPTAGTRTRPSRYPHHESSARASRSAACRSRIFGKKSILPRAIGTASFMLQAILRGASRRNLAGIFFSTSPPLIGFAATIVKMFRARADRVLGDGPESRPAHRDGQNHATIARPRACSRAPTASSCKNSSLVVALDRFMAERLRRACRTWRQAGDHPAVAARDDRRAGAARAEPVPRKAQPRPASSSSCTAATTAPPTRCATLLDATLHFKDDPDIRFLFVGGGMGKKEVEDVHRRSTT